MTVPAVAQPESDFAAILLDQQGNIIDAHPSCTTVLKWERDDLVGRKLDALLKGGSEVLVKQLWQLGIEVPGSSGNTNFAVRVIVRCKNGPDFPAMADVKRFPELCCWTAVFRPLASKADPAEVLSAEIPDEGLDKSIHEKETEIITRDDISPSAGPSSQATPPPASGWRNSRLLFTSGADRQESAETKSIPQPPLEKSSREEVPSSQAEPAQSTLKDPIVDAPRGEERESEPVDPAQDISKRETEIIERVEFRKSENLELVARLSADLEKERGERRRNEQRSASLAAQVQALHLQLSESLQAEQTSRGRVMELEDHLATTTEQLTRAEKELEKRKTETELIEEELVLVKDLNTRLESSLSGLEEAKSRSVSAHEELETRLKSTLAELVEGGPKLQREIQERQRLETALADTQLKLRETEETSCVEISKLNSALEFEKLERQRLSENSLRARSDVLGAARNARSAHEKLRHSTSRPLQELTHAARSLLQSDLPASQKELVEAILKNAMSVRSELETPLT